MMMKSRFCWSIAMSETQIGMECLEPAVQDDCGSLEMKQLEQQALQLRRRQNDARFARWDAGGDDAASVGPPSPEDKARRFNEPDLHMRRRIELDKLDKIETDLFRDLQ